MKPNTLRTVQKWEIYFNILNHILIGLASFYTTWMSYYRGFSAYTMHVWLSTIGYQLLMTEAILVLYASNGWSFFHVVRTKRTIHWVMQVIGSIFAIVGTVCVYWGRPSHFQTMHGLLGLISLILLPIGLINGTAAHWSFELSKIIKVRPIVSKLLHSSIGIAAFVIGMASLYYGHDYTYFQESEDRDMRPWLISIIIITTIGSLVDAIKSFYRQSRIVGRSCCACDEERAEDTR